ncbi:MFS transporter [Escherichia coli]
MTSLKTSIKTITYLSDIGCLEIQGASLAFVIGFTSAGGVVQIGLTLMAERFPYAKGKATGIYYSAGSIATFTIPLITAHLSQRSIADIMWFDTAIAAIGFLLALFIGLRSRKKTRHHSLKENVAPGG